jgi:hypothetical protein
MYYVNLATNEGFWVWNSRDGVTPFCVFEDGKEFRHVDHAWDRYEPDYQPRVNQRYFRNRSLEEARAAAVKQISRFEGTEYAISQEDLTEVLTSLTQVFMQAPKLDRWPSINAASHQQVA